METKKINLTKNILFIFFLFISICVKSQTVTITYVSGTVNNQYGSATNDIVYNVTLNRPAGGAGINKNSITVTPTFPAGFTSAAFSGTGIFSFGNNATTSNLVVLTLTRAANANVITDQSFTVSTTGFVSTGTSSTTGLLTVTPKPLTITTPFVTTKIYDGTTDAAITGTLSGIVSPDVVTLNGTGTFDTSSVGTGKAVTSTSTLGGANAGKYTLTLPTGLTGSITAKALTITTPSVTTKIYDGTTAATITGTLTGIVSPDAVTLNGTGNFNNSTVGTGKAVTSTSTLGGANAGNYSLTQPTGLTGTINKAPLTITANPQSVCFGTADATVTGAGSYTATGFVNGETASVIGGTATYTTNYTSATAAGASGISITPVVTSLTATNYSFTPVAGSVTVNPSPTVSISSPDVASTLCFGLPRTFTAVPVNGGPTPTYEWRVNGSIDSVQTASTFSPTNLVNGVTVSVAMTSSLFCSGPATSNVITITGTATYENTWIGGASNDWNNTANWSCGIKPSQYINATVPAGFSLVVVNNPSFLNVNKLTIEAGATVTIPENKTLTIEDAFINNGTFIIENNANLIQVNPTAANIGNVIVKRNSAPIQLYDYTLWSSPVSNQNLLAFSPSTLTNRFCIYDFVNSINGYFTVPSVASTNFVPGKGYLIRAPNNLPSTAAAAPYNGVFTGTPNNGTITFTGLEPGKFYSFGNPYPCEISAQKFFQANPNSTVYLWRKKNGVAGTGYAVHNSSGGKTNTVDGYAPSDNIGTSQGFIFQTTETSITFTNTMRITNAQGSTFFEIPVEQHRFWLNLKNANVMFNQMLVGYMPQATSGFDGGIDARFINDSPISLTSLINSEEYTIQGKSLPFENTDTVPLAFKTNAAGNFTIAIDHVDGVFGADQAIYLKDNLTNTTVNLSTAPYTFASEIGTFNTRFQVVYQNSTLATPTFTANNVVVYTQNNELTITTGNTNMSQVRIYDMQGRLLAEKKQINATETKMQLTASNQVLVVEIVTENGSKVSKKIIQ